MKYDFLKEMNNDPRRLHKVSVDSRKCMGCKRCLKACAYDVYRWNKENGYAEAAYSEECVCCMQCMFYCPSGAISIERAPIAFFDSLYDPFGMNDEKTGEEVTEHDGIK